MQQNYGSVKSTLTLIRSITSMRQHQHLRELSNLIRELRDSQNILYSKQNVQTIILSPPQSWEHVMINMTHNKNMKTFIDISRHLGLEDERLEDA